MAETLSSMIGLPFGLCVCSLMESCGAWAQQSITKFCLQLLECCVQLCEWLTLSTILDQEGEVYLEVYLEARTETKAQGFVSGLGAIFTCHLYSPFLNSRMQFGNSLTPVIQICRGHPSCVSLDLNFLTRLSLPRPPILIASKSHLHATQSLILELLMPMSLCIDRMPPLAFEW